MIQEIEDYLLHLRRKGRALATRAIRFKTLRDLAEWLATNGIETWQDVTFSHLRAYASHLIWNPNRKGRLRSPWTRYVILTSIRLFFRYLTDTGALLWNPGEALIIRVGSRIPKTVFSKEEMDALLSAADLRTRIGIRDRAWMEVLYATGIRRQELLNLTCADLDLKEEILTVRCGKGGKSRMVPLGKEATRWVLRYLKEVRPQLIRGKNPGNLWLTRDGAPMRGGRFCARLKEYAEKVGLSKPISPHRVRATCATHLLEGGAEIRHVQEFLGHADIDTTQVYLSRTIQDLARMLKRCHPRKKLAY